MTTEEMHSVLGEVDYMDYTFLIGNRAGTLYLQARYMEPDIDTGKPEMQHTRKWQLSEHMTKSELVQTAFKCAITSAEHRTREAFKYKGQRIFGPHFDVDALAHLAAAGNLDVRT